MTRIGSNQFKAKKHPVISAKMVAQAYFAIVVCFIIAGVYGKMNHHVISPVTQAHAAGAKHIRSHTLIQTTPAVTQAPQDPRYDEIKAYIYQVFGQDGGNKAMKLLSCENHSLNPNATNYNSDSVGSIDRGVFQINNYWQKIDNPAFLYDYKINVLIAHNIYVRDGYSFKLWTCGRELRI